MKKLRVPAAVAGLLQVPSDLSGRLLALGYVGLLLLGLAGLLAGNPLALLFIAAAVLGWLFLEGRLVAVAVWALALTAGLAGAILGDNADWLLVALAGGLLGSALVRMLRPRHSAPAAEESVLAQPAKLAAGSPTADSYQPEPAQLASQSGCLLTVRTLGRLAVTDAARDQTQALVDRPVLNFVWTYLLARALLNPGDRITRLALADEVSPGLPQSEQRRRLRSLIYDLQHDLPAGLGSRVQVDGQSIRFDLSACAVDVLRLAEAGEVAPQELLAPTAVAELECLVSELGHGDFLPHFQELEERIAGGRGSAMSVVQALRSRIDRWRSQLVSSLADTYLARQDYERCVRLLEPALNDGLASDQLASRLINAYLRVGRSAEATQLSRQYSLALEGTDGRTRERR